MITQLSSPAAIRGIYGCKFSDVMLQAVEEMDKADGFVNWLDSDIHSKLQKFMCLVCRKLFQVM